MTAVAAAPLLSAVAVDRPHRFYVRMAATCVAVAVVGFAPTYFMPMSSGTLRVAPLVHLHAALFFGWTLFFLAQTWLAASDAVNRHREVGVAGVALATAMLFVGTATAIGSIKHHDAAGFGVAARAFSIVPLTGILLFAILIAIALVNVKQPEIHKRVMLVATVSLLQAGVGRWFLLFLAPPGAAAAGPPPVFVTVMPGVVTDLLIVAAMVYDRRTRGGVHPVYWIAGGVLLAVQVLRVPLSATPAWTRVAEWAVTLAP